MGHEASSDLRPLSRGFAALGRGTCRAVQCRPDMTRASLFAIALLLAAARPALAQVATPTTGDVGSAATRNGFPTSGGAVALPIAPSLTTTGSPTTATTTTSTTAGTTAAASGTTSSSSSTAPSGSAGTTSRGTTTSSGGAATTGAGNSSGSGTAENWVICPPSGASGLAPLFTGTDLSCAPN